MGFRPLMGIILINLKGSIDINNEIKQEFPSPPGDYLI